MDVIVFSDSKNISSCFAKVEKTRSFSVKYHPFADLKKNIITSRHDSVIYADVTALTPPALKKCLSVLASLPNVFGIIDSKGTFDDPVVFIHAGASDYIGKTLFRTGIDTSRIKKTFDFGSRFFPEQMVVPETAKEYSCPPSGSDWKTVQPGKEYTFCFMYIELDNQKEIKKRFSGKSLELFTRKYHDFIEKSISDINGRIWMWADLGGLVLFPFDGSECPAILKGITMMLDCAISSFEGFDYDMLLSSRLALHIGDTVYQERGDTGKIVSDSINSIHHLKQNFAEPGHMYLTEETRRFIPSGLAEFFIHAGRYEGRDIYRFRKFK